MAWFVIGEWRCTLIEMLKNTKHSAFELYRKGVVVVVVGIV